MQFSKIISEFGDVLFLEKSFKKKFIFCNFFQMIFSGYKMIQCFKRRKKFPFFQDEPQK